MSNTNISSRKNIATPKNIITHTNYRFVVIIIFLKKTKIMRSCILITSIIHLSTSLNKDQMIHLSWIDFINNKIIITQQNCEKSKKMRDYIFFV